MWKPFSVIDQIIHVLFANELKYYKYFLLVSSSSSMNIGWSFFIIFFMYNIKRNDILQTDFNWALLYLYNNVWPIFILSVLYKLYVCMLMLLLLSFVDFIVVFDVGVVVPFSILHSMMSLNPIAFWIVLASLNFSYRW